MSLILDALNRSREDGGQVPGLTTQHQMAPQGRAWNRSHVLLGLALILALAFIGWLLLERGSAADRKSVAIPPVSPVAPPATATNSQERVPVPLSEQQREPGPARELTAQSVSPPVEKVEARPINVTPEHLTPSQDSAVAALYNQQSGTDIQGPAPQPEVAETALPVKQARREEQPVDIEKIVKQARDEVKNARLAEHPAPLITALSQQSKDRIPTIYYERHDYSGERSRSSVVLNGKTVKVGGSTASGVRVDDILADSVVLTYQGTQFRLRALNSWVNL